MTDGSSKQQGTTRAVFSLQIDDAQGKSKRGGGGDDFVESISGFVLL